MSAMPTELSASPWRLVSVPGLLHVFVAFGMWSVTVRYPKWFAGFAEFERNLFWGLAAISLLIGLSLVIVRISGERVFWKLPFFYRHRLSIPREGLSYLAIMLVLFIGALLGHNNMLMLVFAMMAGPFVVNLWVTFGALSASRLSRVIPRRVMAGDLFSVEVTLENRRPLISLWMMQAADRIAHPLERLQGTVLFTRVGPLGSQTAHYQLRLAHRGRYQFGPLQLSSRYPLGLIERGLLFSNTDELLVYPRIGQLTSYSKRQQLGAMELVAQPRARVGMFADEFHRLREYRAGDNPRAIHWRTSARRQELMVREFQQNREHSLAVIVDLWSPSTRSSDYDRQFVEDALSLAATLCWDHVRNCRESSVKLGIAGAAEHRLDCPATPAGLEMILDQLAIAEAGGARGFNELLEEFVGEATAATRLICVTTRSVDDFGLVPPRVEVMPVAETPLSWWLTYDQSSR